MIRRVELLAVLGVLLAVSPVAGRPLLQGSSINDWRFGWEYVRSEVFQRWMAAYSPAGPPVYVDAEMSGPQVLYLPYKDVFMVPGFPKVEVGPGCVRVVATADGFWETVSLSARGPAIVDAWPNLIAALLDGTACELRISQSGHMPPYEAVILKGDREVARKSVEMQDMLREVVGYVVYPDRVVFRVLGRPVPKTIAPTPPPDRVIVYTITFLPREGRILVSRTVSRDPRLLHRLARFALMHSSSVQVGVLRTPFGVQPLYALFTLPWEDPLIEAVDRAAIAWRSANEAKLREVLCEHPNIRLPEPRWRRSGQGSGTTLPLPPFPPVGRRGIRRLRRLAALILLALPLVAATPASATTVTGGLYDDYQLLYKWRERALQKLAEGAHVTVYVEPKGRSCTCTYRPEDDSFTVGPSPQLSLSLWGLVRSPRLPDPAVIFVGDHSSCYLVHHARSTYLVVPVTDLGPVVYVLEGDSVRAYVAPDWVATLVPPLASPIDAAFELSERGCVLRYYCAIPGEDGILELTVRIDFSAERPEFRARVVNSHQVVEEIKRRAEEVERLRKRVRGVVVHSLEGSHPVLVVFELPEDHPFRRFVDEGVSVAADPVSAPIPRLISWWLEWRQRFPGVEFVPCPGDPLSEPACAVLRAPWLAVAPDPLAAVCALPIDLALVTLERWLHETLRPLAERSRSLGLVGPLPTAVAYYVPVGLLEEFLGRILLPLLVRPPLELALPVVGLPAPATGVEDWAKELSERALYCAVAPVVDTVAMHRVAELTGSPEVAALAYVLLDTLWHGRDRWLDPSYWLAFPTTIVLPATEEFGYALPLWTLPPWPLAALLYGVMNSRRLPVHGMTHTLVAVLLSWALLEAP